MQSPVLPWGGRGYLATAALVGNSYADTKSRLLFLFMEMFKKCPFLLDAVSTFLKPWSFFLLASPMQKNSLMFIKTWDVTRVHFSVNKQLFRGRKIPSSKMNKVLKTVSFQNGQHKCHCIMKRHRHLTFMEQLLTGHCVHFRTLMPRSVKTNQSPDQHIFNTRKLSGFYHRIFYPGLFSHRPVTDFNVCILLPVIFSLYLAHFHVSH